VTHRDNTWVDHITVAELKTLWEPAAQGRVLRWNQVRVSWPDAEVHLFGAGVDSGTYDYFTTAVVGTEHASRGDFTSSEDDNVLVQGVATDKNSLGFFGFGYYNENADKLKLVPIDDGRPDNGAGPIVASHETVANGTYQPLSRPVHLHQSGRAESPWRALVRRLLPCERASAECGGWVHPATDARLRPRGETSGGTYRGLGVWTWLDGRYPRGGCPCPRVTQSRWSADTPASRQC
jgi:hypothetical protein